MKKWIVGLLPVLLLVSACAKTPEEVELDALDQEVDALVQDLENLVQMENEMPTQEVAYYPAKLETMGYLAVPEGEGPFPALILIHEWWGMNDNIRDFAERFAEQGYIALAVDLYDGQAADTPAQAGELAGAVRENTEGAFANLKAAVDYLKARPDVKVDSMASVGWCFGGQWSYEMAKNDLGVAASVMYYGRFSPADDLSMMKAMILGHFGEEDTSIAVDDVREFQAKLATLSGEHQVFIYPNAGHAFANEDNEEAYDKEAADLAWKRTLDFLAEHL